MKLKKIAALALAGVMAVSMLAGCSGKGAGNKDESSDLSAAVVAQLSKDTTDKITFTANNKLASAIVALKAKYGTANWTSSFTISELAKVDTAYTNANALSTYNITSDNATAKEIADTLKASTATYAVKQSEIADFPVGANTATVAKAIAAKIDKDVAGAASALKAQTGTYVVKDTSTATGYTGRVNFTYTGTVSVYGDVDAQTGIVTYYLVYTITRTGTEAKI